MPPRRMSRHTFTLGVTDEDDRLTLTDRVPFRFVERADTRQHRVGEGDTLQTLAGRYLAPLPNACRLWWVIADFQPEPIHDPTIAVAPGTVLHIPSVRTVLEEVFSEERREQTEESLA